MSTLHYDEAWETWRAARKAELVGAFFSEEQVAQYLHHARVGWMALQTIVESNAWAETVKAEKEEEVPMTTVETATERALLKTIGILTEHIDMLEKGQDVPLTEHLEGAGG